MAEMSEGFNFDAFDQQIADALAENETMMRPHIRRPGEIGGVALGQTLVFPDEVVDNS
jgi:hypothetical protein